MYLEIDFIRSSTSVGVPFSGSSTPTSFFVSLVVHGVYDNHGSAVRPRSI